MLGAFGAVGEVRQHLRRRHLAGERREPHLQAGLGRVLTRDAQPSRVATGDAHRRAAQVLGDDPHLAPHDLGVEGLA
ncbi:MAG: hypothetical protein ACRDN9_13250 [Streptosporangiaceae bacterium]